MLSVPLSNIPPDMRPSTPVSRSSPTPESLPSRHSPDQDDDEGAGSFSLLPPQRSTSGSSVMMTTTTTNSPSKIVATFRQVLEDAAATSTIGSSQGVTEEMDATDKQQQQRHKQDDWMCKLCMSTISTIASSDKCTICGWKRSEANNTTKSHMSTLTKASLELAKKWKQQEDDGVVAVTTTTTTTRSNDSSLVNTAAAQSQQQQQHESRGRHNPRRNSFSSITSIGSASTQKASNTTNEPTTTSSKKPKSKLGELAMFLLASATANSSSTAAAATSSASSHRLVKTPHMSCDDDDMPTRRPIKRNNSNASNNSNISQSTHSPTTSVSSTTNEAKPPRPPQQQLLRAAVPTIGQPSPSRPPRPHRRGAEPIIGNGLPQVPVLANKPIADDSSDTSLALPKRRNTTIESNMPTIVVTKSKIDPKAPATLLNVPERGTHVVKAGEDTFQDEELALVSDKKISSHTNHEVADDGDRSQAACENWNERLQTQHTVEDMSQSDQHNNAFDATEDFADISLHINTLDHDQRSEDAVSISIFSDEQSSHVPAFVPKRRATCNFWCSHPLRLCILVALVVATVLAALSSVINWGRVGSKIRSFLNGSADSIVHNNTKSNDLNKSPGFFNFAPTPQPRPFSTNYTSPMPSNLSTVPNQWLKEGNDIAVAWSDDTTSSRVILGREGTFLAAGGSSSVRNKDTSVIRVYNKQGRKWIQHGGDIDQDNFPNARKTFAFVDGGGLTLAVASSGSIRVYASGANDTDWKQMGSTILLGDTGFSHADLSVALSSNGRTLAVGIVELFATASSNRFSSKFWGHVAVYSFDEGANHWMVAGSEIVISRLNEAGAEVSQTGVEVQLSENGEILAVRDWLIGNGHLESQSNVKVYQKRNTSAWSSMGNAVVYDQVDGGFALSGDGRRLAVTCSFETRVLKFDHEKEDWVLERGVLPGGSSVALADKVPIIVLGALSDIESPGRVGTYTHESNPASNWTHHVSDLVDKSDTDGFGSSVSISGRDGSTLALRVRDSVQIYRIGA